MAAASTQTAYSGGHVAAADDTPVFELATLVRRCMNDASLAATLVGKLTSRLIASIQEIQRLLAAENWPAATTKVHDLKGEAGSLAALRLHAAAAALEHSLRTGRYGEVQANFTRLATESARCMDAAPPALKRLGQAIPEANQPE
jgi:HPt (histidine-containing phosphotransfer) domain-containing protein